MAGVLLKPRKNGQLKFDLRLKHARKIETTRYTSKRCDHIENMLRRSLSKVDEKLTKSAPSCDHIQNMLRSCRKDRPVKRGSGLCHIVVSKQKVILRSCDEDDKRKGSE